MKRTQNVLPIRLNQVQSLASRILNLVLATSIGFYTPVALSSTGQPTEIPKVSSQQLVKEYQNALYNYSPFLKDFNEAPTTPKELQSKFNANEAIVDQDPFFMRSQRWVNLTSEQRAELPQDQLAIQSLKEQTVLAHSSWTKALVLDVSLRDITVTPDYVFFSVPMHSELLQAKTGDGESSPGVFFISLDELTKSAQMAQNESLAASAKAVPFYFFPLSGEGWQGDLESLYWLEADMFVLYNKQDAVPLPIEMADVRHLHKVYKLNLAIGRITTLLGYEMTGRIPRKIEESLMAYPAPGSTAGFGMYLTGLHSEVAGASVWAETSVFEEWSKKIFAQVVPTAKADGSIMDLITPDALDRVVFLGKIIGGAFIGSLALKYTIYRDYFKTKYSNGLSEDERRTGVKGFLKRASEKVRSETKGVFDVFAHSLTAIATSVNVTVINAIEYLGDRFATKAMAPKNSAVRKGFMATLGWSRGNFQNLAVNHKTFWLGAIVLGVVDTGLVALQLIYVTPWLIDNYLGGVAATAGAATAAFVTSEMIRNGIGYLKHGALMYSQEQRILVQTRVTEDVDHEMRRQGLDPMAKENANLRKKRINEMMDQAMRLRGLPGKEEFMFDSFTLYEKLTRAVGYSPNGIELDENDNRHFELEHGRWGVTKPALKLALKAAKDMQNSSPSELGEEVVRIIKTLKSRYSFATSVFKKAATLNSPVEGLKEARDVRRVMTIMSFGGAVEPFLDHLPESVKSLSSDREALKLAAELLSGSLHGILDGDGRHLFPGEKLTEQYQDRIEVGGAVSLDAFALELESRRAIAEMAQKEKFDEEVGSYEPKKKGWFARRQIKKAHERTTARLQAMGEKVTDGPSYDKIYAEELGKIVGLYADMNSEFTESVVKRAEEEAEEQLSRPDEKAYLAKLSQGQRALYKAEVFADQFLLVYRNMSVLSDEYLEASSTEQPGRLQRLRRWLYDKDKDGSEQPDQEFRSVKQKVMSSRAGRWINNSIRLAEAFFSNSSNAPGFLNMMDRSLPFWHDGAHNFARQLRLLPYLMTMAYFVNYHIWQVKMDYPVWALFIALGFTGTMMVEFNNRMLQHVGVKPMEGTWSKVKYAFLHSWLTYPVFIPVMYWAEPMTKAFNNFKDKLYSNLVQPVVDWSPQATGGADVNGIMLKAAQAQQTYPGVAEAAKKACATLLGGP